MKAYITGFTEEKIEQIKTHPYYSMKVEALKKYVEDSLLTEPKRIKFSDIHLFVETGNRSVYQDVYFNYTSRMRAYALAYLLFKDDKYITPLADMIWNICDLECWALPAHAPEKETIDKRRCWLDLCSTNLGAQIGEVLVMVGDKLPELVVRRATAQVRERIIEGYKKYKFWWYDATSNWSAVCIAGVLGSYLYFATEEEIEEQLPNMIKTAEGFLTGFDADGCCMEGYGYWAYGFSYFCNFADLLRNYTNGKIDMFKNPRVHQVAKFQENCAINENQCIRFSDCGEYYRPAAPLAHFLKNEYPDVQIPSIHPNGYPSTSIRDYVWEDPNLENAKMDELKSCIFTDAQWFIYRSQKYNFACKAGHNNEPHNHNDVGSFMISKDGRVTFTDPGGGEYTRQYFSSERYTILEPSSRSHSVPIINGNLQKTVAAKSTVFVQNEKEYAFSMQGVYGDETLKMLKRHFVCEEDEIILTDTYEFDVVPESVVERLVSLVEPTSMEKGRITVGATVLLYDPEVVDFELNTDTCVRSATVSEKLYMFDFKVKNLAKDIKIEFKFI